MTHTHPVMLIAPHAYSPPDRGLMAECKLIEARLRINPFMSFTEKDLKVMAAYSRQLSTINSNIKKR